MEITFIRKNLKSFRKDTFTGFMGVVVDNAGKISNKQVRPFVKLLADEYANYQSAYNYEQCQGLTKQIWEVTDKADKLFTELNAKVKAVVTLGVDGVAVAQEVRNIIVKNGYAPAKSLDTRFEILKFVVEAAGEVDLAGLEPYGIPGILAELNSLRELYMALAAERKALRDKRKKKIALYRESLTGLYANLIDFVELLTLVDDSEDLRNFVVQVNESLIWIAGNGKKQLPEASADGSAESENDNIS